MCSGGCGCAWAQRPEAIGPADAALPWLYKEHPGDKSVQFVVDTALRERRTHDAGVIDERGLRARRWSSPTRGNCACATIAAEW